MWKVPCDRVRFCWLMATVVQSYTGLQEMDMRSLKMGGRVRWLHKEGASERQRSSVCSGILLWISHTFSQISGCDAFCRLQFLVQRGILQTFSNNEPIDWGLFRSRSSFREDQRALINVQLFMVEKRLSQSAISGLMLHWKGLFAPFKNCKFIIHCAPVLSE